MDKQKIQKIKDLALLLDAKQSGNEAFLLAKKIGKLEDEITKLKQALTITDELASKLELDSLTRTLSDTYDSFNTKIEQILAEHRKISKDKGYSDNYFSKEIQSLKNLVSELKLKHGKDGVNGRDGKDGSNYVLTEADKQEISSLVEVPDVTQATAQKVLETIEIPEETGESIKDKLEELKGEDRLDASAIKNLPENVTKLVQGGVIGLKGLRAGTNIAIDNTNQQYPIISSTSSPGGSDTQVQFNDGGTFGGDAGLTYNKTTDTLTTVHQATDSILFDTAATPITNAEGLLQWNATDGTLDLGMSGGDITMQIGQEMFQKVRNVSGSTIVNGTPVYTSGRTGNRPNIYKAQADAESTATVVGITTQDITSPSDGYITTVGYVRGIKTDYTGAGNWGTTWVTGDKLYVSKAVAGQLTNVEPTAPHHSDCVATVEIVHSNLGSILVAIQRHTALEELSDVNGTALTTTGQLPVWNETAGYFDFTENITDLPSDYIKLPVDGGSPTLDTLTDDFNTRGSSGVADGTQTYVTVGSTAVKISVASGEGYIRTTNDQQGELKFCKWAASPDLYTFSAPATGFENVIFIGVEYSGGVVTAVAKTAFTDWNWYTNFPLARCSYDGTTMRILNAYAHAEDTANLTRKWFRLTHPFLREEAPEGTGGLVLSVSSRALAMTAGALWHGFNRYSLNALSSGTAFDTHYKRAGGGFVTTTGVTSYPNTQYDNGSGTLQDLTANRYGTLWVYVDVSDGSLDVVYGAVNAVSVALAQEDTAPTTPDHLRYHGRLIGRIIFRKSEASPTLVESAWGTMFNTSTPGDHNLLSNLQGGTSNEYYHLTAAEYAALGSGGTETGGIGFVIDNGTNVISVGAKTIYSVIDFDCTITGWSLSSDVSGSIVIDVWKAASAIPTIADTIISNNTYKPTLSSSQLVVNETDLTSWTTTITAGDVLAISVDSVSVIKKINLTINVTK